MYLCSKDIDFVNDRLPQFGNYQNEKLEFEEPPFKKRFSMDQILADGMYIKKLQKYFLAHDMSLTVIDNNDIIETLC